ncbi:hypothetical protein [Actinomadura chokoriensis]|uniref:hypothetical protein n=1 Tax=Actinomadura chokoriensis TaxID=454156 RepID=UPI0031F9DA98
MEHYSHSVSAVLSAVTFLEALVNEVFQDAADAHPGRLGSLDGRSQGIMKEFWDASEGGSRYVGVLEKYQMALLLAGKAKFDRGSDPYQDASMLIYLRNRLVHFRPQTVTHGEEMNEEKRLRGRFVENPLMVNMGNPWFPFKCMGAGCAEWAWKSSLALADERTARLGVVPVYGTDVCSFPEP